MYIKSLKIDKNSPSPLKDNGDFNSNAAPEKPQATLEFCTQKRKAGSWMKNIQIISLTLTRLHSIQPPKDLDTLHLLNHFRIQQSTAVTGWHRGNFLPSLPLFTRP